MYFFVVVFMSRAWRHLEITHFKTISLFIFKKKDKTDIEAWAMQKVAFPLGWDSELRQT